MPARTLSLPPMLAQGFLAGFLATIPMTVFMLLMQRLLPAKVQTESLPPQDITENVVKSVNEATPIDLPEKPVKEEFSAPTLAAHFSYGGAAGALYLPLMRNLNRSPARKGALFGTLVWTGSYMGLLPMTGLYPVATRRPAELNILMILAHVVWGASLGLLCERRLKQAFKHP